jgi:hypothetical protein
MKDFDEARKLIVAKMEQEIERLRLEQVFTENMPASLKEIGDALVIRSYNNYFSDGTIILKAATEQQALGLLGGLDLLPIVKHKDAQCASLVPVACVERNKQKFGGACTPAGRLVYDLEFFSGKYRNNTISGYITIKDYIVEIQFSIKQPETRLRVTMKTTNTGQRERSEGMDKIDEWWIENKRFPNSVVWSNYGLTDCLHVSLYGG